jgi:hypothetical protein
VQSLFAFTEKSDQNFRTRIYLNNMYRPGKSPSLIE